MHNKPMLHSTTHPTPVGTLTLVASDRGLRAVVWPKSSRKGTGVSGRPHRNPDHPILKATARHPTVDCGPLSGRSRCGKALESTGVPIAIRTIRS